MSAPTSPTTFGATVRAALDPQLVPLGFTSGQGGDGPPVDRDQVIYCTAFEDFLSLFPHVSWPSHNPVNPPCLDLIVEGSLRHGIVDVRFEGASLQILLAHNAHHEAAREATGWPGVSVVDDLSRIRGLMIALLGP